MRRIKQILAILGHVSTMAWLWSIGGTLLVTAVLGWIAQAKGMPRGWLIVGALGAAVLSFLAIAAILAKLFRSWATQGTLSPTGEVKAQLIPQGGRLSTLEVELADQRRVVAEHVQELEGIIGPAPTPHRDAAELEIVKTKAEFLAREYDRVNGELALALDELAELHRKYEPPATDPEPLNRELVIAIKTYGFPAYEVLTEILNNLWEPVRELQCIGKFLPKAWAESTGQYIREYAEQLSARLEKGDNGEPFVKVWEEFHRAYGVELTFWVGRVQYFHQADEDNKALLRKWLPLHDQYYTRVRELGNAPDGKRIKGWFDRFDSQCTTHRERLIEAMQPAPSTPDTGGSTTQ